MRIIFIDNTNPLPIFGHKNNDFGILTISRRKCKRFETTTTLLKIDFFFLLRVEFSSFDYNETYFLSGISTILHNYKWENASNNCFPLELCKGYIVFQA